jgi:hypothetical protein
VPTVFASHNLGRITYRQAEVVAMLGVSLPTWHRMRRAGKTPTPDVSFGHTRLWTRETIDKWISGQSQVK